MISIDIVENKIRVLADSGDRETLEAIIAPISISAGITGNTKDGFYTDPSFVDLLGRALVPVKGKLVLSDNFKAWRVKDKSSIKIECGVLNSKIKGDGVPYDDLEKKLKYFWKPAINNYKYKNGWWDGYIKLFNIKTGGFPTGLLYLVEEMLKDKKINYQVIKRYEEKPERIFDWIANDKVVPEEDQIEAINSAAKYLRGVIKAPTGFGKTAVLATRIVAHFGVPALFIANKKTLLDDASSSFKTLINGLDSDSIGQIKDGVFDKAKKKNFTIGNKIESKIIVGTIQSIDARLKDPQTSHAMKYWLANTCKLIIVDECQSIGTEIWDGVLDSCNAPLRFMLSATPYRTDGASLKIHAQSGDTIFCTSAEEQILKGRLCELDIKYIPYDHKLFNQGDADILYPEAYDSWIVNNGDRNQLILNKVREMLEEERMTLVLINRIDHGDILKALITEEFPDKKIEFIFGDSKDKDRIKAIADARIGEIDVLIGSTIFDAGVDIPAIAGVIITGAGNSDITLIQKIGRGARKVDYEKALGRLPKFMVGQDQKVTKVYDILDENVKFFEKQAWNRYAISKEEYGAKRVKFDGEIHKYSKQRKTKEMNTSTPTETQEKMMEKLGFGNAMSKMTTISTNQSQEDIINMFKL